MPKKIDRDLYRTELAKKAALLFSKHGYAGLGMRSIAMELGISKSALYHYFSTKKELFLASTEVATQFDKLKRETVVNSPKYKTTEDKVHALFNIIRRLEPNFPNELSLLVEYLRDSTSIEVANDKSRKIARENYINLVNQFISEENSTPVLCLIIGTMTMRFLDGSTTSFDEVEKWLVEVIQHMESDL